MVVPHLFLLCHKQQKWQYLTYSDTHDVSLSFCIISLTVSHNFNTSEVHNKNRMKAKTKKEPAHVRNRQNTHWRISNRNNIQIQLCRRPKKCIIYMSIPHPIYVQHTEKHSHATHCCTVHCLDTLSTTGLFMLTQRQM